jgi:DMSO/TMAO reductase YedYZ molybdopterin-dependent catalytic subunit
MKNKKLDLLPVTEKPFNAETPLEALINETTPSNLFYVRNHFDVPEIKPGQWRLEVNDEAGNSKIFYLNQIKEMPVKSSLVILECAGNGRSSMNPIPSGTPWNLGAVSQTRFTGTPLNNVLKSLNLSDQTIEILFVGADQNRSSAGQINYARSLPFEVAAHPDTLLVWGMNGEPLRAHHGYPLRLLVPRWYGMASVKWLKQIVALNKPYQGFFQRDEYVYKGELGVKDGTPVTNMRVRSLILVPHSGSKVTSGEVLISGIAWSGEGHITGVEVSFDLGENWEEAAFTPSNSVYAAGVWMHLWQPKSPGDHTISVRASDSARNIQPLSPRWNQGGYGNNSVHQIVVTIEP